MKVYKRYGYRTPPMLQDPDTTAWIPEAVDNPRYQEVLAEIAAQTATTEEVPEPPAPDPTPVPRIATKLLTDKKDIVDDQTWQPLGGVAVNAQFYVPDLTKAFGIIEFSYKAAGTQAQLQIIEIDNDENERVLSGVFDLPASAGWKVAKFQTNEVPGTGDKTYELRGRLNGATSAAVRYCSVVLIELVG